MLKRRRNYLFILLILALSGILRLFPGDPGGTRLQEASAAPSPIAPPAIFPVHGTLQPGQTLTDLFKQEGIGNADLYRLIDACDGVQDLRKLKSGRNFRLLKDGQNHLVEFRFDLDDEWYLVVDRDQDEFVARKEPIPYAVRPVVVRGVILTHLVDALAGTENPDLLAIDLSEIFAWDIDFATDLRRGDQFEFLVEELRYEDGRVRYGQILSATFVNGGESFSASWYETADGFGDYYDPEGRPLRRGFLRSPLRYKYISSGFSRSRLHPILKIRRPHLGVDYAAPSGTPVSASGDGTVAFAARKGGFGKYVEIRHPGGYVTSYGHLSRIASGIRRGAKVEQGQIIGNVGNTGLSSGPHLDYRVQKGGAFIDPLHLKAVRKPPLEGPEKQSFAREYARLELLRAGAFFVALQSPADEQSLAR